jgi:hypothetical protein
MSEQNIEEKSCLTRMKIIVGKVRQTMSMVKVVVLFVMLIYGYFDQRFYYNPPEGKKPHYIDFVSNWNEICCLIWAILNALHNFKNSGYGFE